MISSVLWQHVLVKILLFTIKEFNFMIYSVSGCFDYGLLVL
jgi:hypothetical protein